ncbi:MAG: matrixin family metalloprotease [Planctomycetota bacterium]
MKYTGLILPTFALGGAALILALAPDVNGYSLLGGSLGTTQRDFRVFDNFTDGTANDNQVADAQFPGHQGAVMAIWKASVEWASSPHGNGNGDPHQPGDLGSGGANFDPAFAGEASSIGTTNNNIHSELSGGSGGVLAYCETPISDGWRIRYYQSWVWQDGPSIPFGSQIDLQGVACHEYGHALGLDHSASLGATMYPSISGTGFVQRSIATDDANGVQAIYGVKSASKPEITGVAVSGSTVTINGSGFGASGNEVWFTNKNVTASGVNPTVKVTGVSASGGLISVAIPADAGPGDVLVKTSGSGHATLSNPWPVDVTGSGSSGGPLAIASISPGTIDALNVGSAQNVTITGTGFTPATTIEVNGTPLFGLPSPYTVVNGTTITFDAPVAPALGTATVTVRDGADSDSATLTYTANSPPALQAGNGDAPVSAFSFGGLDLTLAGEPGELHVLLASTSNAPTAVPGFFDLGIGNGWTSLFHLGTLAIGPSGTTSLNIALQLPPLTTFYLETLAVDPAVTLPLPDSNTQAVLFLF